MKEDIEIDTPRSTPRIYSRSPTIQDFQDISIITLDRTFFILYTTIVLYIFLNSICFYVVNESSPVVLIIGLTLSFCSSLTTGFIIYYEKYHSTTLSSSVTYPSMYLISGLVIIATDPQNIALFIQEDSSELNSSYYLIFMLSYIGSKYIIKNRKVYLILTYTILILAFILGITHCISIFHHVISFILLAVFVYCMSLNVAIKKIYQYIDTEPPFELKIENPNTALEEIISEIHLGIERIMKITKDTHPAIQQIYTKIVKFMKNIINKIKNTDNIYLPKLELVTKNMDEDDRLYIEQEFFESYIVAESPEVAGSIRIKVVEYGISELAGFLRVIGKEWNFNSFFVAGCTKTPAVVIGQYAIKMYGLDEAHSISEKVLESFLTELELKYPSNPYHNSLHAADVMCSFIYLAANSRLYDHANSLEWLGGIVASLAHDVGHPGMNNRFLIMTGHKLAITYNDISVLESFHASTLFQIASESKSNIFASLSNEKFAQIRKLIIEMILATDLAKHFDIISYMRTKYNENSDLGNREIRADMLRLCLKSADVGHAAKSLDLHEKWCLLIIEEFYNQGDKERERGLPISMYCDRENTNLSKSQEGFIKNIVLNLFTTLNSILGSDLIENMCVDQLKHNEAYWKSLGKQRNLSSTNKKKKKNLESDEKNIYPLLKKRTERKGSLPPLLGKNNTIKSS